MISEFEFADIDCSNQDINKVVDFTKVFCFLKYVDTSVKRSLLFGEICTT